MAADLPRLSSTRVPALGYRVFVRCGGPDTAAPVVLVHGIGVSGRYLVPTARRLARRRRVVVPDLPGFGLTSARGRVLGIAELGAVLAEVIGQHPTPVTVVANSFGCQLAAHLAADHPSLVRALVLVGPTVDEEARSWWAQAARWSRSGLYERPSYAAVLVPDYLRAGQRRLLGTAAAALRDPVEEVLPRVIAPTLVVRGERDPIASQAWVERLAQTLPDGHLAVVPGAGHAVNHNAPEALAHLVETFLDDR